MAQRLQVFAIEEFMQRQNFIKGFSNRVEEHMTEHPAFSSVKTPVNEAAEFMNRMGFRHLPVLDDGKLVGIVSERDLKQAILFTKELKLTLEDVMTPNPYIATTGSSLYSVLNEMVDRKIGSAIVIDPDEKILGIFTTTDAMNILAEMLEAQSHHEYGIEKYISWNTLI